MDYCTNSIIQYIGRYVKSPVSHEPHGAAGSYSMEECAQARPVGAGGEQENDDECGTGTWAGRRARQDVHRAVSAGCGIGHSRELPAANDPCETRAEDR